MEFVGRPVTKAFEGSGDFSGTVKSYDASSKFFKVVYENGDSEEVELIELLRLFREPRKQCRMAPGRSGNLGSSDFDSGSAGSDGNLGEGCRNAGFKGDFRGGINLNVAVEEDAEVNLKDVSASDCNGHVGGGFDLNSDLDLNKGFSPNDRDLSSPEAGVNSGKGGIIDLNLDATSYMDEESGQANAPGRKKLLFDLNLGINDEMEEGEFSLAGPVHESMLHPSVDEAVVNVEVKFIDSSTPERSMKEGKLALDDFTRVRRVNGSADLAFEDSGLVSVEVRNGDVVMDDPNRLLDSVNGHRNSLAMNDDACEPSDTPNNVTQTDMGGSSLRRSSRRRKRKEMDSPPPDTALRRSTRRVSSKNQEFATVTSMVVCDRVSSPAVSAITEEKPEDTSAPPPKLDLPPSRTLDLDRICIFDVFSVFSCLRSFSTLLFLSPFDLEDFISALRSDSPNSLFDCIHVSLLHTVRKHLEHLSSEGSGSALHCLRSLNWDLLDSITWPLFLVEYLLLHGSGINVSELSSLKIFARDYCKQPASVKLNILQCLCDEVIDTEVIRSELTARSLDAESDMDLDRTMSVRTTRKRRDVSTNSGRDYLSDELTEYTPDRNSDDCCLCKMDGNLLCCDGCPAAFHSKCVGIVSDLLPEGDWFCPECVNDRNESQMKQCLSLRGAELLGSDPYNRLYFSCCGYLLVSDSSETEVSYKFYHKDDLTTVVEVLKSSEHYSDLLTAIYKQWSVSAGPSGTTSDVDSMKCVARKKMFSKIDHRDSSFASVPVPNPVACGDICKAEEKMLEKDSVVGNFTGLDAGKIFREPTSGVETLCLSSEGSTELTTSVAQTRDMYLAHVPSVVREDNMSPTVPYDTSLTLNTVNEERTKHNYGTGYVNYYSSGRLAESVVEELLEKIELNKDLLQSDEEIISQQLKIISKKVNRFRWPSDKTLAAQREKCGWCFCCRASADGSNCLFNMYMGSVYGGSESDLAVLQAERKKDGHFIGVVSGMLSLEYRLRGLLLGPWQNSQHSEKWRKSVIEALDLAALKSSLLQLSSCLHQLAISEEWTKYEDSALILGSASHIVTTSTSASSKPGPGRKKVKFSDPDSKLAPSASSGPGMFCWRGGRLSRRLFSWKVVPQSLVSKAARGGGRRKIPGIFYPDNSDFARRSRYLAWHAAVESSTTISQLALQLREFDSNIKWDEIENMDFLCKMDKELRKSHRAFKKVIVRRKITDGDGPKYLLDFGKRRVIPEVVIRHGSVVEEGSSERKRYWLNESLLPLHIMKGFEEKKIARISNKKSSLKDSITDAAKKKLTKTMTPSNQLENGIEKKHRSREKGFAYLFLRAERAEYSRCGNCDKDVLTSEAVSCQHCKGLFHEWHAEKTSGAVAECTYTCHLCQKGDAARKNMTEKMNKGHKDAVPIKVKVGKGSSKAKLISQRGKLQPQNYKNALAKRRLVKLRSKRAKIGKRSGQSEKGKEVSADLPVRRSARQAAKYMAVQSKARRGRPKGKQNKSKRGAPKRRKDEASHRKKRTRTVYSYWLDGLHLSRGTDDKRVTNFREESIFSPSEYSTAARGEVKCSLCGGGGISNSSYIACEICRGWYHGDAFGLDPEKMKQVIGFRCHVCRGKDPPVCPCIPHFPGVQNISIVAFSVDANGNEEIPLLTPELNFEGEGLPISKKQKIAPSQE